MAPKASITPHTVPNRPRKGAEVTHDTKEDHILLVLICALGNRTLQSTFYLVHTLSVSPPHRQSGSWLQIQGERRP